MHCTSAVRTSGMHCTSTRIFWYALQGHFSGCTATSSTPPALSTISYTATSSVLYRTSVVRSVISRECVPAKQYAPATRRMGNMRGSIGRRHPTEVVIGVYMRPTSPSQEMTINSSQEKKKRRRYRQFSLNCNQHRARRSHAT